MAARSPRLTRRSSIALLAGALLAGGSVWYWDASTSTQRTGPSGTTAPGLAVERPGIRRIVSLVPALTETLYAIGAGSLVVGVSSFDRYPPDVELLPRVGALVDPDAERILALRPDLVLTYGSQEDARARFERAGIQVYTYRHGGIEAILGTIARLGSLTGQQAQARDVIHQVRARLASLQARVAGRRRPHTLVVFERTPQTLRGTYVSGGAGFLNEMLQLAGGTNVFADVARESVQPSHETILARGPEVILEIRADGLLAPGDAAADRQVWSALSTLPAVRNRRVHFLNGEQLVVPGPRLADGVEQMARALHPEAFQ
jgi:iron complex transport system substrate-binding protein